MYRIQLDSLVVYFSSLIVVWIIAFLFLGAFQIDPSSSIAITRPDNLHNILISGVIAGIIWGGIFKIAKSLRSRIPTYFLSMLLSVFVNIASAYLLVYCIYNLVGIFIPWDDFPENITQLLNLYRSPFFYAILAYFFTVGSLIEIFYEIDRKLGQGVLLKFLLGQYYQPKEEERVFLFMDLKSSTFYAEKLGHFKYSRLIQDCFKDISSAVVKNHAQIYQYVGDEVVLTWNLKKGIENFRCIQVFIDFTNCLEAKKEYYQKHYGMVPVFKAGVHCGKVMVAQVGELKSEIAYHGDAINTASRLQGLCNAYNSKLLMSGNLLLELKRKNTVGHEFLHLGEVLLTGKEIPTEVYSFRVN